MCAINGTNFPLKHKTLYRLLINQRKIVLVHKMRLISLNLASFFFFYKGAIRVVIYLLGLLNIALLEVFVRKLRLDHKTLESRKLSQELASDFMCSTYRFG